MVMFTGLENADKLKQQVIRLGGIVEESDVERITHMVSSRIKRTEKFLAALSRSPPPLIMSTSWLTASSKLNKFAPSEK